MCVLLKRTQATHTSSQSTTTMKFNSFHCQSLPQQQQQQNDNLRWFSKHQMNLKNNNNCFQLNPNLKEEA